MSNNLEDILEGAIPPHQLALFRDKVKDGVYVGPKVWPSNITMSQTALINDLGTLEKCNGSLDLMNSPLTSLGNLQSVDGNLILVDSEVTYAPNLKEVHGHIELLGTKIKGFPLLEEALAIDIYEEANVPFMPNLKGDCDIYVEGTISEIDVTYQDVVETVLEVDLTELLVFKNTNRYLTNLIDARLKGLLKRKPT